MKRLVRFLLTAAFISALAPSQSFAGVDPSCYGTWSKTGTLTRTFVAPRAANASVPFGLTFDEFAAQYAIGGLITVYHKNSTETYEDGYIYDMDVGFTDLTQSTAYQLPAIDFDGSYTLRITDPADTPFAEDFAHATHALVEEYEPGDYEAGYYYAQYYVIDASGIFLVGRIEMEGDGTFLERDVARARAENLRAPFPLDETLSLDKTTARYDEDFERDIQTREIVEMHGYGALDLSAQFGSETLNVGAFINDLNYQEPGETDPNVVIDFQTNYSLFGEDGTYLNFYVAVRECEDENGCEVAFKGEIEITDIELWRLTPASTVAAERGADLPEGLALHAAYPNPAQGRTTLGYTLPEAGAVRLALYDALGREVAVLAEGTLPAGDYDAIVEGSALPSGVYLARLTTGTHALTQRVVLSR